MSDPRWEESAALGALGLLEAADRTALERRAARDPEVAQLVRDFSATAAMLALDAPPAVPPPELKQRIMAGIAGRPPASRIIAFPPRAVLYAVAACLVGLVLFQSMLIMMLNSRLSAERLARVRLQQSDSMLQLRIAKLESKNIDYLNANIMVAWDPIRHRGMISMHNLPAPPPGRDYQLWVLDPTAPAPMSAGLLTRNARAQDFAAHPVGTSGPGFAISMEPAGGRSSPTPGAILFAVAPGP